MISVSIRIFFVKYVYVFVYLWKDCDITLYMFLLKPLSLLCWNNKWWKTVFERKSFSVSNIFRLIIESGKNAHINFKTSVEFFWQEGNHTSRQIHISTQKSYEAVSRNKISHFSLFVVALQWNGWVFSYVVYAVESLKLA